MEEARSRIEAILGNMLGGDYVILPPMSRNEELLLALSSQWEALKSTAPNRRITNAEIDACIATL